MRISDVSSDVCSSDLDLWPLRTLRVAGQLERVDEQKLREAVLPYARNGFFAIRLDQARAAVDKLPWVDQAEVRKHWPDVVEVRIVEHRPFARWGDDQLLSEDRSEEHKSELQSLMRISYAVFCL